MKAAGVFLSLTLALSAWVSQLPYFFWLHRNAALIAAATAAGAAGAVALWLRRGKAFERREVLAALGLLVFLVYITAQRTVAGDHDLWIFIVPTVIALAAARPRERRLAYTTFEFIFILSLIPGLILSLLLIAGVPVTFWVREPPNPLFAATGIRMLEGIGAVLIESNSQGLPWGGVISRLCGMYDEPGMVGTIAALMLAVRGFEVKGWRSVLLWLAGILSLSLAFVILAVVGFAVRAVAIRRVQPLLLAAPVALTSLLILGIVTPAAGTTATETAAATTTAPQGADSGERVKLRLDPKGSRVRQTTYINNRSLPEMDALVDRYLASDWKTIALGIASDASVVHGGVSAVWTRVLTNHGVLGLLLVAAVFGGYGLSAVRRAPIVWPMILFLSCFALSFYQRPVIWLPYTLLVFFGGLAMLERQERD